jgi:hypothetical protein
MKKTTPLITTTFVILSFFAAISARASVLFQDALNYPNGCIETDGLWYAYTPASPHQDAFVTNNLLILNQTNYDGVAAPSNNFANPPGNTLIYASFTINVSTLPTVKGGYFANFKDKTNDYVGHIFIATTNTMVPGTYQLGIDNFLTGSSAAAFFPLDLATGITYQVVVNYDDEPDGLGGTLWVNPASEDDAYVYGTDTTNTPALQNIVISQIAFSQYTDQGVAAIGDVMVGTTFGDVLTKTPQVPVIGINPQSTNLYSGDNLTLYTAASGLGQLTYQWLSNNVPLSNGAYVSGSASNILTLTDLKKTANYSVAVTNSAGGSTSAVAVVSVNTTATPPFFIAQPYGATNTYGSTITLSAVANGTGPLTYQWYFSATGSGFSTVSGQTSPTLTLSDVTFAESGSYYVQVTGGAGSPTNSATVSVLVVPPSMVTIGFLHSLLESNPPSDYYYPVGTTEFNVQGVVTSFGEIMSQTYSEFFIQDGTGGALVFLDGFGNTYLPPVGALVQVTGQAQEYYGELEVEPANPTNITVISYNNPPPAPAALNLPLMATNPMGAYGLNIQCSLVTITNVYLYSSSSGAPVSGNFPTNYHTYLYAFAQPYVSTNQPYMEIYVYTYTNSVNQLGTNYFGKPLPNFAYQVTGAMGIYSPTQPEIYPSRYADFVTTPFGVGLNVSNGVSQLTWPMAGGSTYSVYSATNLLGPWTRTSFWLGYNTNTAIYKATNAAAPQFYKVSTP